MSAPESMTVHSSFRAPRVRPNATHAFGGIWRFAARRFFTPGYWVMLPGMLVLLVIFSIPAAPNHAAAARGLIPWAGGFYICFLLPVFAFISAANAIRDDFGAGKHGGNSAPLHMERQATRGVRGACHLARTDVD